MQQSQRLSQGLRSIRSSFQHPAISLSRRFPSHFFSQLSSNSPRPSLPAHFHGRRNPRIPLPSITLRYNSDTTSSSSPRAPLTDRVEDPDEDARNAEQNRLRREQEPAYQLTFTCKPCGNRSSHRVSKHGYHRGTVLIRCQSCMNRHVISDHLGIFFDKKKTLEDLLEEQGQKLTRGELHGDMEFWDDGTAVRLAEENKEKMEAIWREKDEKDKSR